MPGDTKNAFFTSLSLWVGPAVGKSRGTAPCKLSLNLFLALLHLQFGEMCRCVCWWCLKTGIIESRQRVLAQTLQHIFPSSMASKAFAQPWWHPERWWASQNHPWSIVKYVLESFISLFLSFSSIWTLTKTSQRCQFSSLATYSR